MAEIWRNGCLYCGACGVLAQTGDEEYDWCDHATGAGCTYMDECVGYDDDDYEEFDDEPDFNSWMYFDAGYDPDEPKTDPRGS